MLKSGVVSDAFNIINILPLIEGVMVDYHNIKMFESHPSF
jgi:hypothetical protein